MLCRADVSASTALVLKADAWSDDRHIHIAAVRCSNEQQCIHVSQVPITFLDASSRGGTYYLPHGYSSSPRPLMVAFHGLDGHGSDMVDLFMVRS